MIQKVLPMRLMVMGPPRTATSVLSGLLSMGGVWFGDPEDYRPVADSFNPAGYYELRTVNRISIDALAGYGFDRWGGPLPPQTSPAITDRMRAFVETMDGHELWAIKAPRLALTWRPWWAATGGVWAVIRTVRDRSSVIRSWTAKDPTITEAMAARVWEIAMAESFNAESAARAAGLPGISLNYDEVIHDPVGVLEFARRSGIPVTIPGAEQIASLIDLSVTHQW
jgi:hypothetical protein